MRRLKIEVKSSEVKSRSGGKSSQEGKSGVKSRSGGKARMKSRSEEVKNE